MPQGNPIVPLPGWLDNILRPRSGPRVEDTIQDVRTGGSNINTRLDQMGSNQPQTPTDRLLQIFQPETRFTDRLYDMIDTIPNRDFPEREDYKPSIWRRLGASVIGGKEGLEFNERPFNTAVSEFDRAYEPIKEGAGLERQINQNSRIAADDIMQRQLQERRDADRVRIQEARLNLDRYKATNPESRLVNGEDGFVYLVNPRSGESVNTQLRHGELSDLEKMRYGFEQDMTLEEFRQSNREGQARLQSGLRIGEEQVRQDNRIDLENIRQTGRYNLARERQRTGSTTESQSQLKNRYVNNANKLMQSQPDTRDWIDFDENGYPIIKTVEEMVKVPNLLSKWFGAKMPAITDKEKAEAIRKNLIDVIYGQEAQPISNTSETSTIRREIPGNPGKYAVSKDGGLTWVAE